jgi:nucleoside-diphosphate-sugar epimerase
VTGGAGYIGSVTVEWLRQTGEETVVFDDLARGAAQQSRSTYPSTKGILAITNHLGQKKSKAVPLVEPLSPISGDDHALVRLGLRSNSHK